MTQAYNLSQLANKVDANGKLDITTGTYYSGTNSGKFLKAGLNGAIEWADVGSGGGGSGGSAGDGYAFFTQGSGNWLVPAGVKNVKIICIGGGGGGRYKRVDALTDTTSPYDVFQRGGYGGCTIGIYGVTAGATYAYTVGTGGDGGYNNHPPGNHPPAQTVDGTAGTSSTISGLSISGSGGGTLSFSDLHNYEGQPGVNGIGSGGNLFNGIYTGQYMWGTKADGAPFINETTHQGVHWTLGLSPGAGGRGYGGGVGGLILIEYL